MTLEVALLYVLYCVPRDIEEHGNVLDCAYTGEVNYIASELIRIAPFACNEVNLLLADTTALLAFYSLYFHAENCFSMTYRNCSYVSICATRTDNLTTFALWAA